MSVQVVYCNHETAPLALRERIAFAPHERLTEAYANLREQFSDCESVILSTCNRIELYTAATDPDVIPPTERLARFLSDFHQVPLDDLLGALQHHHGHDAVRHLFEVTSSLDSMVLGEPQIVKQVKEAYSAAESNACCGPLTHLLFQGAIRVSSRVRTETKLSEGRVSIASVAVGEFAKGIFDRFDDKTVLIIGAGDMAEETLRYLTDEGAKRIVVINRSRDRAVTLADRWGGSAQPWDQLDHWLKLADMIVSTTGATEPIISPERFSQIRAASDGHPVFVLDLGAPRDFAPGTGDADDNVFLYDIDALEETCRINRKRRQREITAATEIIETETEKFYADLNHRATGPIIRQLRDGWDEIKESELKRLFDRLPDLDDDERDQIEHAINRIVNKLLHPPLETLKLESRQGTHHGLLDALRQLFHLGE